MIMTMPKFQIFTPAQIKSLLEGGRILRECLDLVKLMIKPGVKTKDLDEFAEEFILSRGAKPGFKGYRGFPNTLCTSVNEECVHGIPGRRLLKGGDIISVDCGVIYESLYTDASFTSAVGAVTADAKRLIDVTSICLANAVGVIRAGARIGDISAVIEKTAELAGFHPVRALTGHGIGSDLHQFPDIPNFGTSAEGPRIPANTILAVEPIISAGSHDIVTSGDGWTLSTKDGSLCAHFEHTLLVQEQGCEILA